MQVRITEEQRRLALQVAAALGALLLVVSLFLTWYSLDYSAAIDTAAAAQEEFEEFGDVEGAPDLSEVPSEFGLSGWTALEFADAFLLFGAIVAALVVFWRRRESAAGAGGTRAAPTALLGIGIFLVLLMLVLLFTKSPLFGAVDAGLDLASDIAALTGQPDPSGFVSTSIGIGTIIALIGALLILLAGLLDGFVKAVGPSRTAPAATETTAGSPPPPSPPAGETRAGSPPPGPPPSS